MFYTNFEAEWDCMYPAHPISFCATWVFISFKIVCLKELKSERA